MCQALLSDESAPDNSNCRPSTPSSGTGEIRSIQVGMELPTDRLRQPSLLENTKAVTYWSGVSLVVSQQIGSGIFSTPALINVRAGSVGMSLILWIFAGCVAWCGACTFARQF